MLNTLPSLADSPPLMPTAFRLLAPRPNPSRARVQIGAGRAHGPLENPAHAPAGSAPHGIVGAARGSYAGAEG
jgi:hypothetical protein